MVESELAPSGVGACCLIESELAAESSRSLPSSHLTKLWKWGYYASARYGDSDQVSSSLDERTQLLFERFQSS